MHKFLCLIAFTFSLVLSTTQANADGGWLSAFDLSQSLHMSWVFGPNVVTASPVNSRVVDAVVSDPWTPVNFETGFRESEAGQSDDIVVMSGPTGIPLVLCHSGYFRSNPQLCEWLRSYIQGGKVNAAKTKLAFYDGVTQTRQKNNLVGAKMALTQGDATRTWAIDFIVEVAHEDVDDFSQSADNAVVVVTKSMSDDQTQDFLKRVNNGEVPLLLATCSWGNDVTKSGWGSYGRYVAVMFPDEVPDVKP